jgi:hypothetical protein
VVGYREFYWWYASFCMREPLLSLNLQPEAGCVCFGPVEVIAESLCLLMLITL